MRALPPAKLPLLGALALLLGCSEPRGDLSPGLDGSTDAGADAGCPDASELDAGSSIGPDIQVLPPQLNFGRVSLIAPARRTVLVTNAGDEALVIDEVVIVDREGAGAFSLVEESPPVLEPGDAWPVPVAYQPPEEAGEQVAELQIRSNDPDTPLFVLVLRAPGRPDSRPCAFDFGPSPVDFGPVRVGETAFRELTIENRGSGECLLSRVAMLRGAELGFRMVDGPIISRLLSPGDTARVELALTPEAAGPLEGALEFSISSPTSPFNVVPLDGVGRTP